jgi:hypothetical protein
VSEDPPRIPATGIWGGLSVGNPFDASSADSDLAGGAVSSGYLWRNWGRAVGRFVNLGK